MINIDTLKNAIAKEDEDLVIGRYFHFTDFLDLLFSERIKFTQISCFDDGQEGFLYNQGHIDGIEFSKHFVGNEYAKKRIENELYYRTVYYASCWVLKSEESNLMWNSYSNLDNGILLKTTIKSLIENIREEKSTNNNPFGFYFGKIDYGWEKEILSYHQRAFGKNKAFIDENEFRIVAYIDVDKVDEKTEKIFPKEITFPINLSNVVDEIILSPKSNDAFKHLLKTVLEREGLSANLISKSEIKTSGEQGYADFIEKLMKFEEKETPKN